MTRIVVDPGDLRDAARLLNEVAHGLDELAGRVQAIRIPPEPRGVLMTVEPRLGEVSRALRGAAPYMREQAQQLQRRAIWAEIGGNPDIDPFDLVRKTWKRTDALRDLSVMGLEEILAKAFQLGLDDDTILALLAERYGLANAGKSMGKVFAALGMIETFVELRAATLDQDGLTRHDIGEIAGSKLLWAAITAHPAARGVIAIDLVLTVAGSPDTVSNVLYRSAEVLAGIAVIPFAGWEPVAEINRASLAGEKGWLMQKAAEAGEFYSEGAVGDGFEWLYEHTPSFAKSWWPDG